MKITVSNLKRLVHLVYAEAQGGLSDTDRAALESMRKSFFDADDKIGRSLTNLDGAVFILGIEAMKQPTYPRRSRT